MQKTIYIKDEELWREIRAMAGEQEQSISGYLVSLHRDHVTRQQDAEAHADAIDEDIALVDGLQRDAALL